MVRKEVKEASILFKTDKKLRDVNVETMEENLVHITHKNILLVLEFPENFPGSPLKVEVWSTKLLEHHTEELQKYADTLTSSSNCIFQTYNQLQRNKKIWDSQVLLLEKQKARHKEECIRKEFIEAFGKPIGIDLPEMIRRLEIKNAKKFDISLISIPKPVVVQVEIPKTKEELEKEEAKNVHQAKGTMFKFLNKLSVQGIELNLEKKTEILANIKGFSTFIMSLENQKKAATENAILEIVNLIKFFANEKLTWDAYCEEIMIHATFVASKLSNYSNVLQNLFEMRLNSLFWILSKRMRGEIRYHLNIILEKLGTNLSFELDLFKLFNDPTISDFTFICADETVLHAHKCIIFAFCVDFDLKKDSCTLSSEITSFAAFNFLKFIYGPTIFYENEENLNKMEEGGINELLNHVKEQKILNIFKKYQKNIQTNKRIEVYEKPKSAPMTKKDLKNNFIKQAKEVILMNSGEIEKLQKTKKEMNLLVEKQIFQLCCNNDYSDLSFSCIDSEKEETVLIPVHKPILICRSDYFQTMFASGLSESTQEVIDGEFNAEITKIVLNYLYNNETINAKEYIKPHNVVECLYASDLYMILPLKSDCEKIIVTMINLDNFDSLTNIADEFNCPILLEGLKKFSSKNDLKYNFKE
jgi:hypothetical protein